MWTEQIDLVCKRTWCLYSFFACNFMQRLQNIGLSIQMKSKHDLDPRNCGIFRIPTCASKYKIQREKKRQRMTCVNRMEFVFISRTVRNAVNWHVLPIIFQIFLSQYAWFMCEKKNRLLDFIRVLFFSFFNCVPFCLLHKLFRKC